MKHFAKLIAVFCLLPLMAQAQSLWQEGTHYKVIADTATDTPQVKEVFSFWCPACNNFEVIAKQIKSSIPSDAKFIKAHVNFLGGASKETQDFATAAMLSARAMKDEARFNEALFAAIHQKRNRPTSLEDIADIYAAAGGDGEKLKKLAVSFGVKGQIKRNNKATAGITSVPAFVVNEKYQAIFTRDMTPDSFVKLINYLLTQK